MPGRHPAALAPQSYGPQGREGEEETRMNNNHWKMMGCGLETSVDWQSVPGYNWYTLVNV